MKWLQWEEIYFVHLSTFFLYRMVSPLFQDVKLCPFNKMTNVSLATPLTIISVTIPLGPPPNRKEELLVKVSSIVAIK